MTLGPQPPEATRRHRLGSVGIASLSALAMVLPATSYALWAMIGAALAFNAELQGRSEVLVQLALGLSLLIAGLLAAAVRRPLWPLWRSLTMPAPLPPNRERLLAMMTLLPMLGVAGLVRGDNDFWATRLLGGVLALSCLAVLISASVRIQRRPSTETGGPGDALISMIFSGGLWFWMCMVLQGPHRAAGLIDALRLGLLVVGLTAALTQWPAMHRRRLAALLAFVVPCLALVVASTHHLEVPMAMIAAFGGTFGLCLDAVLVHLAAADFVATANPA